MSIKKFVFGSTPYNSNADIIIKNAKNLWHELSSDDPKFDSAKLGQVTEAYVEATFPRIIGVIASLLKLREKYFSP